jgi:hypothetical protein
MMNCQAVKSAIDAQPNAVGSMAHLDHCMECRSYATEMTSLLQLLRQQPRIEVPATYDFRLRARIAQAESAQAEAVNRPFALLFGLFSTASGRMASAVAVLSLVVGVSFYSATMQSPLRTPAPPTDLTHQNNAHERSASELFAVAEKKGDGVIPRSESAPRIAISSTPDRSASNGTDLSAMTATEQGREMVAYASTGGEVLGEGAWRVYSLERREMISSSLQTTLIGAELSLKETRSGAKDAPFVPSI